MKLDLRSAAVGRRLDQVRQLRRLCLSLARSSTGRDIARRFPTSKTVQRTSRALGR